MGILTFDLYVLDDNVSRETFESDVVSGSAIDIMPFSVYNTYQATIPEPYLTYMQSFVSGLTPVQDYVVFVTHENKYISGSNRTSTVYNIAVGDISYNGNFSGDVDIYKIYAQSSYFDQFLTLHDSNFELHPNSALVFTNLTSPYPDLGRQFSYQIYIFYLLVFFLMLRVLARFFKKGR